LTRPGCDPHFCLIHEEGLTMSQTIEAPALDAFEAQRPRLRGLAYRMLGTVGDADDILQDAYLRWHGALAGGRGGDIRVPAAWLTTIVTRLCIDRLRAVAAERAAYVGPWLPEPWMGGAEASDRPEDAPDSRLDRAADLSVAFLLLLERLAPEERAGLLLHDVFDVGYGEIAETLGKSEAACRQMVHRARARVQEDRPRFQAGDAARRHLLQQFLAASEAGDSETLLALLAPDAAFTSDGGGKTWAARKVILGADRIARLMCGVIRKRPTPTVHRLVPINGAIGLLSYRDGRPWSALTIDTDGERILAVYRVLNPDKLVHLPGPGPV
jgi:RNA polymerase sigma-70 factor (ECF subfamily)